MRVSNQLLIGNFLADLGAAQRAMARLQHQAGTGKAFDRPVDDPSASAVSMNLRNALQYLAQYGRNVDDGQSRMSYTETIVQEVDTQLQRVRELTVQGSNTYLTKSDRNAIAQEMNQLLEQVITLSNANFRGRYIFSGYKTLSETFASNTNTEDGFTNSVTYRGDMGIIGRNIGINRDLDVSFTGKDVFTEQTYSLTGRQLADGALGFSGVLKINTQQFIVSPTMTLAQIRDMINTNTATQVQATIEPGYRLKLTSLNSTQAIQASDLSGNVLRDLGVLPMGAFNLAQAAPPGPLPLIDSRGAHDQTTIAFAPFTLGTANQNMVLTLAGAANDGFSETKVLKLDAITYNTAQDLAAQIQSKADAAFGEKKLLVRTNEIPPASGNWFIEIETYVQSSAVTASDLRIGGTAPDGTTDSFSDLLGFTAAPGALENADNAGSDGNDRFTIDLGLNAYRTIGDEQAVDLPVIELNLDGDVTPTPPGPPLTVDDLVANINKKILDNQYLSGLVEAVNDGGRIRIQTTKKDGSVQAGDLVLANAVAGPVVPATDTLGALGFYRDALTGVSSPPVPATVVGTNAGPYAIVAGVNDQFSIDLGPASSIDGTNPGPVTITLTAGAYANPAALAAEINTRISLSPVLKNAVVAAVGLVGVDIVTANTGSRVQAADLQLADVTLGALANIGLNGPTVPGGGSSDGQGIIVEPRNMVDTMIQIRDELLGYAGAKSRLVTLNDADGKPLGLFPGSTIRISSDGSSQEFVVQRFTTMQDFADELSKKLGFQVDIQVLRDGRIELYNPSTVVVNDIKIEAFDQHGAHVTAFEQAMDGLSGKLTYRGVLRSDNVYEDERFQHLTNRIGDVDSAFETVMSTLAQLGSRTKRLEMTSSQSDAVEVNLRELQTKNDYVDMAEVITRLNEQQNVLRAALGTGAKVLMPSLFDFLS